MKFSNTYINLPNNFYQVIKPEKVPAPKLMLFNQQLADDLLIPSSLIEDTHMLAQYLSGAQLPPGAQSIALAYSGHQFGHFNPQLGDGRAHLLGEIIDSHNIRQDIQLKGSGATQFSRQGDGKCALGPAIREFIMSEAMHALNVPTTRCLAVVTTGEKIYRETELPGAVVTRVATSHIRVGTFQFFAARGDLKSLETLTHYAIARHFPEIDINSDKKYIQFIEQVCQRQITLITQWLRVGFIHGVMNTDNTAISGDTIDFGPCAMLGAYHPGTVYSSIDKQGRYAYGNQANIGQWNMARLAECLLPLINKDEALALSEVEPLIMHFSQQFEQTYFAMLSNKLGLPRGDISHVDLINELLEIMQKQTLDHTQTFLNLTLSLNDDEMKHTVKATLGDWYDKWQAALTKVDKNTTLNLMTNNNPVVIPRNHHVEAILADIEKTGNTDSINTFLKVLRSPYKVLPDTHKYQDLPLDGDRHYHTFCGT